MMDDKIEQDSIKVVSVMLTEMVELLRSFGKIVVEDVVLEKIVDWKYPGCGWSARFIVDGARKLNRRTK